MIFDRETVVSSSKIPNNKQISLLQRPKSHHESITSGIDRRYSSDVSLGPLIMFEGFFLGTDYGKLLNSLILSRTSEKLNDLAHGSKWREISSQASKKKGKILWHVTLHKHNFKRVCVTCTTDKKYTSGGMKVSLNKNEWTVDGCERKEMKLKENDTLFLLIPKWRSNIGLVGRCICTDFEDGIGEVMFPNGETLKFSLEPTNNDEYLPALNIAGCVIDHWAVTEKPKQYDVVVQHDAREDEMTAYVAYRTWAAVRMRSAWVEPPSLFA